MLTGPTDPCLHLCLGNQMLYQLSLQAFGLFETLDGDSLRSREGIRHGMVLDYVDRPRSSPKSLDAILEAGPFGCFRSFCVRGVPRVCPDAVIVLVSPAAQYPNEPADASPS